VTDTVNWADLYRELLADVNRLAQPDSVPDSELRERLATLAAASALRRPQTRAQRIRERLIDGVRPIRALMTALVNLPLAATGEREIDHAQKTIDVVPLQHPFKLRYHNVEKVDWESCEKVLASKAKRSALRQGW
jgi:hypothetical protein